MSSYGQTGPQHETSALPREPAKSAKRRRGSPWLWITVLLIAGLAYVALLRPKSPVVIEVEVVRPADLATTFTAEAVVRGRTYELAPESGGRIIRLLVSEGDIVREGQILMEIDPEPARDAAAAAQAAHDSARAEVNAASAKFLAESARIEGTIGVAKAGVDQALANLARVQAGARPEQVRQAAHAAEAAKAARVAAEQALLRARSLYGAGAIPKAELEQAEAAFTAASEQEAQAQEVVNALKAGPTPEEVRSARVAVEFARRSLELSQAQRAELSALTQTVAAARERQRQAAAELRRADGALARTVMRTPASGTVIRVRQEAGSVAMAGAPNISLSTREDLHIEAEFSSEDVGKGVVGMPLVVMSPTYPGREFSARLVSLMPQAELKPDAAIRVRIVRGRVALNEGWEMFRPGLEVDVSGTSVQRAVLTVPTGAVVLDGDRPSVWIVRNGRAVRRQVEFGFANAVRTEIRSGLAEGDQVIVEGNAALTEGQLVEVAPAG